MYVVVRVYINMLLINLHALHHRYMYRPKGSMNCVRNLAFCDAARST